MNKRLVFAAGMLAGVVVCSSAWAKTWTGAVDSFWGTPGNWEPSGVPTIADAVTITNGTCYAKSCVNAASIDIAAAATLYFASTGSVTAALAAWPAEPTNRSFTVAGDLVCAGKLAIGGRWTVAAKNIITNLAVSINGDFILTNGAVAAVYAATTPDTFSWANLYSARTCVDIAGSLSISDTSVLYPECDSLTGAPIRFSCASFYLGASAKVNAQNRGWLWYAYSAAADLDPRKTGSMTYGSVKYFTLARHQIGASYTDHGQYGSGPGAYGYAYAPFMSGAPSGLYHGPTAGGGQVWIVVTGKATVNGQILADGTANCYGTNSGGGIWLCAKQLVAGGGALLSSKGGTNSHSSALGGGTGGRISLGLGLTASELAGLAAGNSPADLGLNYLDEINEISVDVSGGRGGVKDIDGNYYYTDPGTATVVYGSLVGISVLVRGVHAEIGSPEPGYGPALYDRDSTNTFTCTGYGYDSASVRYSCIGYVVSNTTEEIAHGDGNSAVVEIGSALLSVTWIWGNREVRYTVKGAAGASLVVNGNPVAEGDASLWTATGSAPVIEVVPAENYEFICWEGPIPYGQAKVNPITLPAGTARDIKPVVRAVAAATTRTWTGGSTTTVKVWTDASAWSPNGIPGTNDDVVITGKGTMLASNYFECASLALSGSAALKVANSGSSLLEEAALVVHGDLKMTNTASLLVAPRNYYRHGRIEVGGNFALDGTNSLTVSAGPTNGTEFTFVNGAGFVNVGGDFTVGGASTVVPNNEPYTGGSVVFRVGGSFTLTTNAAFKANVNGFSRVPGRSPVTLAPGWGYSYTRGAGYGGYGVGYNATYGNPYGFEYAPIHPGSPCGDYNNNSPGGGAIGIHVAGKAVVAGRLDASARFSDTEASSASGGGVWLTAGKQLTVAPGAILKARGGKRITGAGVPGGGGRIALGGYMTEGSVAELAASGTVAGWKMPRRDITDLFLAEHPTVTVDVEAGENNGGIYKGTFRVLDGQEPSLVIFVR